MPRKKQEPPPPLSDVDQPSLSHKMQGLRRKRGRCKINHHLHGCQKKSTYNYTQYREQVFIEHTFCQHRNGHDLEVPKPDLSPLKTTLKKHITLLSREVQKQNRKTTSLERNVISLREETTLLVQQLHQEKKVSNQLIQQSLEEGKQTISSAMAMMDLAQSNLDNVSGAVAEEKRKNTLLMQAERRVATTRSNRLKKMDTDFKVRLLKINKENEEKISVLESQLASEKTQLICKVRIRSKCDCILLLFEVLTHIMLVVEN